MQNGLVHLMRDKQKCPPPVTCALNFVLFYWAAFCRFGFRISLPFQSGLKSEHINIQSSSIHASFGFQIQVSSTCNSLPITNSSSCLTSSPRPFMCCLCVAERKNWTCRRVEEDQWSGYRFQTNFQLLVLAELRYIQRLTEATLKAPLWSQFLSAAHPHLHLHQLQLPSRKWPSHESHVNLCIRTQKSHKDRDEIRKITNAKLHYFPPVIATILQCWPEGSASEISQGLSLGHLEISSDRRIQNDQSQGLRTNIIYIYNSGRITWNAKLQISLFQLKTLSLSMKPAVFGSSKKVVSWYAPPQGLKASSVNQRKIPTELKINEDPPVNERSHGKSLKILILSF